MEYINLGKSGLKVSRICLGCMTYGNPDAGTHQWALREEESRPFIKRALELGFNFFDTANVYSKGASEEILGRAIKDFARREEVVIATKVFSKMREEPNGKGLSRKAIMQEMDASLKRLGMDYVDLYQTHRWDAETPIEETMEALHDLVKAGKTRYIGASSMYAWQFAKALYTADLHGWTRFISMQNQYNLIYREEEREMMPFCEDQKIGVIPWSPLARGFLAGNRTKDGGSTSRSQTDGFAKRMYFQAEDFAVADKVTELAEKLGVPNTQVALAWMFSKPYITAPIIGATKMLHLDDAVAAATLRLTPEQVAELEKPYVPHPVLGVVV